MARYKKEIIVSVCILLAITFLAYLPSLKNGFTNWDDDKLVTGNLKITSLSRNNVKTIFTTAHVGLYHPLVLLSYAVEYRFFGLDPAPYHATNLALHLINMLLVFWLFFLLSDKVLVAFITALLFGIHPLHVASVAWVTERKDVLYSLFFLGAALSYVYYLKKARDGAAKLYIAAVILFILSLLSKPMAVTLPAVLILFDYLLGRKFDRVSVADKVPFFAIAAVFTVITIVARSIGKEPEFTFTDNIFIANYGLIFYLVKTVFPVKLSCYYPPPLKTGGVMPNIFLFAPVAVIAAATLVVSTVKRTRKIIFGALFYFVTVLPVLHLVSGGPFVGDHYTYIPLLGIFYLAGEGFSRLYEKNAKYRNLLFALLAAAALALSFLTWQKCLVWKNSVALWDDFFKNYGKSPNIALPYNNRANAYSDAGDYDKAIADYDMAITIDPDYADALNNRGNAFNSKGDLDKAIADYDRVLSITPNHAEAHYNRGNSYIRKGDYSRAIEDYSEAVRIKPAYFEAYNNLGNAYSDTGQADKAFPCYEMAIKINPNFADPYSNRGNAYMRNEEYEKAIADYSRAILLNPRFASAYHGRAAAFLMMKDYDSAWRDVRAMQRLGFQVSGDLLKALKAEPERQ